MKNTAEDSPVRGKDPVNIVLALLKELSIPVTDATVKDSLLSHPHYPSLLSISDNLQRWGVATLPLEISRPGLAQLPCPFLAHCPIAGQDPYLIVKEVHGDSLMCMDGRRKLTSISLEKFCAIWDGKVLAMEKGMFSGEEGYSFRRRAQSWTRVRTPLLLSSLLLLLLTGLWPFLAGHGNTLPDKVYSLSLFIGNLLGLLTTMLLLGIEYGRGDDALHRFCTLHKNMSCEAVLHSRVARPGGWFSWSELGFIYFAGSLLYGLLEIDHSSYPAPLVVFNGLALGYTAFSLFYQGLVLKKWCILCLLIQGILLGQGLSAILTGQMASILGHGDTLLQHDKLLYWHGALTPWQGYGALTPWRGTLADYGMLLSAYFLPAACWMLFKPLWLGAREAGVLRQGLKRLKRNELVFQSLLRQEPGVRNDPQSIGLVIGNAAAEHSLLLISNPFCTPCAEAHQKLERLLESNPHWKARIIFSIPIGQEALVSGVMEYFIAAAETQGEAGVRRALNAWYGDQKTRDPATKNPRTKSPRTKDPGKRNPETYPAGARKEAATRHMATMRDWCNKENIRYTPTIYVNGHRMPDQYDMEDLQFL